MIIKILFILSMLSKSFAINSGTEDELEEEDDVHSCFQPSDLPDDHLASYDSFFKDIFSSPLEQSDDNEAPVTPSISAATNNQSEASIIEEVAKKKFLEENLPGKRNTVWHDLQNDTFANSWNKLCFLLWKKPMEEKNGIFCGAIRIYESALTTNRNFVKFPHSNAVYQVDHLNCICPYKKYVKKQEKISNPEDYFYVTPSKILPQHYYILKYLHRYLLDVFDLRKAMFDPKALYTVYRWFP